MHLTTVLFDLDGTLLPMDQDVFVQEYFRRIAAKLAGHGYEPKKLIDTIWRGTMDMIQNDGSKTNEAAFWKLAVEVYGEKILHDKAFFDEFYETEFDKVKEVCSYTPAAAQLVQRLKKKGYRLILATNPIFPERATRWRIGWAGLKPSNFELITTYENCHYCKPNPKYYQQILEKQDLAPESCLMVGNDVGEDMVAKTLGMQVFLLTDCLINRRGEDISGYPNGSFAELNAYIDTL